MQKEIADFRKPPFMLKNVLDHINSIKENDASWSTTAERAILNEETELGLTIKVSRGPTIRKSSPLSVQQFREQVSIPYHNTLIANINSHLSGEVVQLVVLAPVINPGLLPDD